MAEPREPLKWREDRISRIAIICLSGVCLDVGTIHFISSGGKADFVLVALIVICFAPWLGRVFESIGKDGVKFRGVEQGEDATEPTPTRRIQSSGQVRQNPVSGPPAAHPPVALTPQIQTGIDAHLDPDFNTLSDDSKKVLATLWKYQQIHVTRPFRKRWTFIVSSQSPDFAAFVRGVVELGGYFLVGIGSAGHVAHTNEGLAYCDLHSREIATYPHTYDQFDN